MKWPKLQAVVWGLIFVVLYGCGGSGNGGEVVPSTDGGSKAPVSRFNATFIGNMTTEGERDSVDTIHMSLTAGSPLNGTFFRESDGDTGTISGDVEEDSATYNGRSEGDCPSTFGGSMRLSGTDSLTVSMEGSDCRGPFRANGVLTKVASLDMRGRFRVTEQGTITCTSGGQSETETISGTAETFLEQTGQNVRYFPSGANLPREGEIERNNISFSGEFVQPQIGEVNLTENRVTLRGEIRDENFFTLRGSGVATGSVSGIGFSCQGTSTAEFKRRFDVLLAVLRGGPFTIKGSENDPHNVALTNMAVRHRSNRVAAKVFDAFPAVFGDSQITQVQNWFREQNTDETAISVPAVLVGHSLGGDGALRVQYENICSRIVLDHWDPTALSPFPDLQVRNQRTEPPRVAPQDGQIVQYLAESPSNGLLGRHLTGSNVSELGPIPGTDHQNITQHEGVLLTLDSEIARCSGF